MRCAVHCSVAFKGLGKEKRITGERKKNNEWAKSVSRRESKKGLVRERERDDMRLNLKGTDLGEK